GRRGCVAIRKRVVGGPPDCFVPPACLPSPLRIEIDGPFMFAILLRKIRIAAAPLLAGLLLVGCATQAPVTPQPQPPVAAVHPYPVPSPNGTRIDNYYWLRDDTRSKPEVLNYLKAENAYYAQMTQHTQALQDTLYKEITARLAPDDASVPVKYRHCWYQT